MEVSQNQNDKDVKAFMKAERDDGNERHLFP